MDKCKQCDGSGEVDSGASTPWGTFYHVPCDACEGTGKDSFALIDWARELLGSAEANKLTNPEQWAVSFGRFWAASAEWLENERKVVHIANRIEAKYRDKYQREPDFTPIHVGPPPKPQ